MLWLFLRFSIRFTKESSKPEHPFNARAVRHVPRILPTYLALIASAHIFLLVPRLKILPLELHPPPRAVVSRDEGCSIKHERVYKFQSAIFFFSFLLFFCFFFFDQDWARLLFIFRGNYCINERLRRIKSIICYLWRKN